MRQDKLKELTESVNELEKQEEILSIPIQMIGANEIPAYAHAGDAGFDLRAMDSTDLRPGEWQMVSAGFSMAIPESFKGFGLFGFLVPRSSSGKLSFKLANTVGIIDSGYRGEIRMMIKNDSYGDIVSIKKGDKVCQMLIMPYLRADFHVVDDLEASERGADGFGSTGR